MADMMKKLSGMGMRERMRAVQQLGTSGMLNPGAKLAKHEEGHRQAAHPAGEGQAAETARNGRAPPQATRTPEEANHRVSQAKRHHQR